MLKFLYKINNKFDHLPETRRFLTFMGMMVPAIVAQGVAEHFMLIWLYSASWIYLLSMLTVRVLYMNKVFHPKAGPNE